MHTRTAEIDGSGPVKRRCPAARARSRTHASSPCHLNTASHADWRRRFWLHVLFCAFVCSYMVVRGS
eukprot:7036531-Prymnesium_polylepis.2